VPDLKHLPPPEFVGSYEAVRLFLARAQARRREFALTPDNAYTVAAVCARLDGIPLAIELAAARAGSLPVEEIAARLDQRFRLLTGGPRDAPSRQQTLRATLDWSWALLSPAEQALLRRLSVFAGGWTLAAAEAVCTGDGIERWEVLDGLDGLVSKSLAHLDEREAEARYGLLETVRQYAAEYLVTSGEEEVVRARHLAWCLALVEQAEPALTGPEQDVWLGRLEQEHDNLRVALRWASERGLGERGLRLAGALWRFWWMRGYFSEGRGWLEAALASGGPATPLARARALNGAGILAESQSDLAQAMALHEEALAWRRALGDKQGIATSLNNLGNVAYWQGRYAAAATLYGESLDLFRELGHKTGIVRTLGNLGNVAYGQGDYTRAAALQEESLVLQRELGDKQGIATSLNNLGNVAERQGDYVQAAALYEESLALRRELGNKEGVASTLTNLGLLAYIQDDYGRATTLLREALLLSRDIGAKGLMPDGLEGLAWSAVAQGQPERAARLGGAAETLREALGMPLPREEQTGHDRAVRAMRAALSEDVFATTWEEGRAMPLQTAISLALDPGSDR
jgi:tetratricopeptide (TPR) repeat protein